MAIQTGVIYSNPKGFKLIDITDPNQDTKDFYYEAIQADLVVTSEDKYNRPLLEEQVVGEYKLVSNYNYINNSSWSRKMYQEIKIK